MGTLFTSSLFGSARAARLRGAVLLLACALLPVSPAFAVDKSTYSFSSGMNCGGVWPLPDTGQNVCYDGTTNTPGSCSTTTPVGQDGNYQPSAAQPSYTVLNPVGISSVTVDNVTGLMWLTNPRTDAGFKGTQTWESALTSCTVTLNGMAYAGYSDWRLPNIRELGSIVHYGAASGPYINLTYFPGAQSNSYWTSSNYVPNTPASNAWRIRFDTTALTSYAKTSLAYVRCVRGGVSTFTYTSSGCAFPDTDQSMSQTATSGEDHEYASSVSTMSFTIYNGAGWGGTATSSVTVDNRTGLMWITNQADAGIDTPDTWVNAIAACEGLSYAGLSDWRLANINELLSIVDYNATAPAVKTDFFPNSRTGWLHTATTSMANNSNEISIQLSAGWTGNGVAKTNATLYFRCVRGGP